MGPSYIIGIILGAGSTIADKTGGPVLMECVPQPLLWEEKEEGRGLPPWAEVDLHLVRGGSKLEVSSGLHL